MYVLCMYVVVDGRRTGLFTLGYARADILTVSIMYNNICVHSMMYVAREIIAVDGHYWYGTIWYIRGRAV